MNDLQKYLEERGASSKLAKATGLPQSIISRYRTGKYPVSLRSAILIEKCTEGAVRAESMLTEVNDVEAVKFIRGRV